jgi:TonB family protein
MKLEYSGKIRLSSSIVVLTAFFYVSAAPPQESKSQNTTLSLGIENSEKSPLQIMSATVADIIAPTQKTNGVTARLVDPKIILKNNSDNAVSLYVLEFRKGGLISFYLTRTDVELAPKEIDTIDTNSQNTFLSAGEGVIQSTATGNSWTVRVNTVRFKDGNVVRLHAKPIVINRGNFQDAELIKRVEPVYPELAKRARVQGQVVMQVTIDEEGNVTDVKVLKGPPLLSGAAIAAVKQWKYRPALMNGEPTSWIVNVTLNFTHE